MSAVKRQRVAPPPPSEEEVPLLKASLALIQAHRARQEPSSFVPFSVQNQVFSLFLPFVEDGFPPETPAELLKEWPQALLFRSPRNITVFHFFLRQERGTYRRLMAVRSAVGDGLFTSAARQIYAAQCLLIMNLRKGFDFWNQPTLQPLFLYLQSKDPLNGWKLNNANKVHIMRLVSQQTDVQTILRICLLLRDFFFVDYQVVSAELVGSVQPAVCAVFAKVWPASLKTMHDWYDGHSGETLVGKAVRCNQLAPLLEVGLPVRSLWVEEERTLLLKNPLVTAVEVESLEAVQALVAITGTADGFSPPFPPNTVVVEEESPLTAAAKLASPADMVNQLLTLGASAHLCSPSGETLAGALIRNENVDRRYLVEDLPGIPLDVLEPYSGRTGFHLLLQQEGPLFMYAYLSRHKHLFSPSFWPQVLPTLRPSHPSFTSMMQLSAFLLKDQQSLLHDLDEEGVRVFWEFWVLPRTPDLESLQIVLNACMHSVPTNVLSIVAGYAISAKKKPSHQNMVAAIKSLIKTTT